MTKVLGLLLACSVAQAEMTIPDGTKVRLRLDQTISSGTADEGQTVEFSVTEAVKLNGTVVIPEGARATGTVLVADAKRRMGRAGKLDFSADRVRAADGEWVPLRYTVNKKAGDSHAVSTGVLTAGLAVVFWPAAPFMLMRHGKDVQVNKGVAIDVFTDANHEMATNKPAMAAPSLPTPATVPVVATTMPVASGETGMLTIRAADSGAEVEVNGVFYGNAPTTLKLAAGQYTVVVKSGKQFWQRVVQVSAGGSMTLNADFASGASSVRAGR